MRRVPEVIDAWFDSGSMPFAQHHAPFENLQYFEERFPADYICEALDQTRGWFYSLIAVSTLLFDRSPYRTVLCLGIIADEQGRKMSKSLGNTIAPQDVMAQSGADVLRLWVSMVDYREDIRLGKEVLARTVEAYRKIRNVIRVLVANLFDFDPIVDAVARERMLEIDRWALAKYAECAERIVKAYDDYDYPAIFQAANTFITVDLSAFYVDVTKDRMYTFGATSQARRSGQTAMYTVAEGLARLLAPILSVTADELWRTLPGTREPSVHLALFPRDLDRLRNAALQTRWADLAKLRDTVNVELERQRQAKAISSNLSAAVDLAVGDAQWELASRYDAFLPTLFGVSQVRLSRTDGDQVAVAATRAAGTKCERCWRVVPEVSTAAERAGLCPRCVDALGDAAA
jgi:isoleucyl-tRNA synthetase